MNQSQQNQETSLTNSTNMLTNQDLHQELNMERSNIIMEDEYEYAQSEQDQERDFNKNLGLMVYPFCHFHEKKKLEWVCVNYACQEEHRVICSICKNEQHTEHPKDILRLDIFLEAIRRFAENKQKANDFEKCNLLEQFDLEMIYQILEKLTTQLLDVKERIGFIIQYQKVSNQEIQQSIINSLVDMVNMGQEQKDHSWIENQIHKFLMSVDVRNKQTNFKKFQELQEFAPQLKINLLKIKDANIFDIVPSLQHQADNQNLLNEKQERISKLEQSLVIKNQESQNQLQMQEQYEQVQDQITDLKNQKENILQEYNQYKIDIIQEIADLKKTIAEIEQQLQESQKEIQNLKELKQKIIEINQEEKKKFQEQLQQLESDLNEKDKKLEDVLEENENLKVNVQEQVQKIKDNNNNSEKKFEEQLQILESDLIQKGKEFKDVLEENENLKMVIKELEEKIVEEKNNNNKIEQKFQEQLQQLESDFDEKNKEMGQSLQENENLKMVITELEQKIIETNQEEKNNNNNNEKSFKEQLQQFESDLNEKNKELGQSLQENENLKIAFQNLEQKIIETNQNNNNIEKKFQEQLQQLESDLNEKNKEFKDVLVENENLKMATQDNKNDIEKKFQEQLQILESDLNEKNKEINRINNLLNEVQYQKQQIEEKFKLNNEDNKELRQNIEIQQERIQGLEQFEQDNQLFKNKLGDIQQAFDNQYQVILDLQTELEQEKQNNEQKVTKLNYEIKNFQQEIEKFKEKMSENENQQEDVGLKGDFIQKILQQKNFDQEKVPQQLEDIKNAYQKKLEENNHFWEIEIMRVIMNITNNKILEDDQQLKKYKVKLTQQKVEEINNRQIKVNQRKNKKIVYWLEHIKSEKKHKLQNNNPDQSMDNEKQKEIIQNHYQLLERISHKSHLAEYDLNNSQNQTSERQFKIKKSKILQNPYKQNNTRFKLVKTVLKKSQKKETESDNLQYSNN